MKHFTRLLASISFAVLVSSVSGGSLGFNFVSDRVAGAALAPNDAAGVVPRVHWNNFVAIEASPPASPVHQDGGSIDSPNAGTVTQDDGVVLGDVTVSWTANNSWSTNNGTSSGDNKLMNGYIDNSAGVPTTTVAIGGLPMSYTAGGGYSVVAYFGSDGNGRTGTVGDQRRRDLFIHDRLQSERRLSRLIRQDDGHR